MAGNIISSDSFTWYSFACSSRPIESLCTVLSRSATPSKWKHKPQDTHYSTKSTKKIPIGNFFGIVESTDL